MVRDQVSARVEELRAAEDERRAREWAAHDRQSKERRDRERVERLTAYGGTHALLKTIRWTREDSERAQRDVVRELRRQVSPDWTEDDIRDCVMDILDDWVEEGEEDDTGDDEQDDGSGCQGARFDHGSRSSAVVNHSSSSDGDSHLELTPRSCELRMTPG